MTVPLGDMLPFAPAVAVIAYRMVPLSTVRVTVFSPAAKIPSATVLTLILKVPVRVTVSVVPESVPSPVPPFVPVTSVYVAVPALVSMPKYCDTSTVAPVYAILLSVPVMTTGVAALFLA